jgi:D-glycero-alpha-D-manno-heptose-7-phosphate kinase
LDAFGRAAIENTEAQAALNPGLVSSDARAVIQVSKAHGVCGYKINGAGGDGGSMTIISGADHVAKRTLIRELLEIDAAFVHIPVRLSQFGLRRWTYPFA